jgi:hypothetical protein
MAIPLWLKLAYAAMVAVIVPVYWRHYGPVNFLWLSDIALACIALAVITENRLLASMPAVGVLPLELAWTIDFMSGGRLLGLAAYMFDSALPLYLRALSLFHLALPPTIVYLLWRGGYDDRALYWQTIVTLIALGAAYLAQPKENVNWVYGPGQEPQHVLPPLLYLGLEMAVIPLCVILPMHFLLRYLFATPHG